MKHEGGVRQLSTHNINHNVVVVDNKGYCLECTELSKDTTYLNMYSYATQDELLSQKIRVKQAIFMLKKEDKNEQIFELEKHLVAINQLIS